MVGGGGGGVEEGLFRRLNRKWMWCGCGWDVDSGDGCYSDLPIRLVVLVLARLTDVFRRLSVLKAETLTAPSGQPLLVNNSMTSTQLLTRANVRLVLPS